MKKNQGQIKKITQERKTISCEIFFISRMFFPAKSTKINNTKLLTI